MDSVYLTTPIFYVNADPHLGHAYTAILGDVFSRYHRQRGRRTRYLTGTDEHGEKVAQSAARAGITPQQFADDVSRKFREAWPGVLVEPDDFIRTTEPRHEAVVSRIVEQLHDRGEIYKGAYRGLYCVGCERYLTPKELKEGKCPDHGIEPKELVEENYLFRMEKHREWLRDHILANPGFIEPERYRNEVLAMLRDPIGDLSISRPRSRVSWGIPLPFDADHVLYVWFDALLNYVSALGGPGTELFDTYWPSATHLIAKDILKPHGIFWPIMLRAAGLPLFRQLRVHGYWLVDASKMSKTVGNVVRPHQMVDRYGADAFRYFLMRDMVFGQDADFSEVALAKRRNADLANDLGNLLSRVSNMVKRYCGGRIPAPGTPGRLEQNLLEAVRDLPARVDKLMEAFQTHAAIEEVLQAVRRTNQYLQEAAPWKVVKDPERSGEVGTILYHAAEVLRLAAVLLYPVIPRKAVELLAQLGCDAGTPPAGSTWSLAWGNLPVGAEIRPGNVLFPKIDLKALQKEIDGDQGGGAPPPDRVERKTRTDGAHDKGATRTETGGVITFEQFQQVALRVAVVLEAERIPKARNLLKLRLDLGDETRTVVAGIAQHYTPEQLPGKRIVVVANLKPARIRGVESQGMILAAEDTDGRLSLVTLDRDVSPGSGVR